MKLSDFLQLQDGNNFLQIKVIPKASQNQFVELMQDNTIKLRLKGIPENGKVNNELIRYLSKEFFVNKKNIVIISGKTAKLKKVKISF